MPEQEIQQKPASDPVVKLYRPDPIRRSRARDYSHWQQAVQVELKTDTAQRFLERNFNQTNETLQYLDYMLVILRDDTFAKPLADELGTMFASFIEEAKATVSKLKASAENTTLPFAVQSTTYDNARTYEAVLLSGNSVDMLAAIVELDHLSMMIDTARGKRVISTFDRKNLLEQWVDTLTKIVLRVRTISSQVRDRNNELRKEREERQQKELEARNRERAHQEQARANTRRNGSDKSAAGEEQAGASTKEISTPEPDASKADEMASPTATSAETADADAAATADAERSDAEPDSDKIQKKDGAEHDAGDVGESPVPGSASGTKSEHEPSAALSPEKAGEADSDEIAEKQGDQPKQTKPDEPELDGEELAKPGDIAGTEAKASSPSSPARRTKRAGAKTAPATTSPENAGLIAESELEQVSW